MSDYRNRQNTPPRQNQNRGGYRGGSPGQFQRGRGGTPSPYRGRQNQGPYRPHRGGTPHRTPSTYRDPLFSGDPNQAWQSGRQNWTPGRARFIIDEIPAVGEEQLRLRLKNLQELTDETMKAKHLLIIEQLGDDPSRVTVPMPGTPIPDRSPAPSRSPTVIGNDESISEGNSNIQPTRSPAKRGDTINQTDIEEDENRIPTAKEIEDDLESGKNVPKKMETELKSQIKLIRQMITVSADRIIKEERSGKKHQGPGGPVYLGQSFNIACYDDRGFRSNVSDIGPLGRVQPTTPPYFSSSSSGGEFTISIPG
ncbi:hypothetical protein BLNAU_3733 [Blattamonas nauphoetae]|uniref:Uncharacterized protein n=1 Tax=Blattamonas nauphoetae TaxID=2049346 RepID=A0ABQ9YC00_9EUKA|nr:hypothetical protein BLNAU_3733 [Blattamonas nauphoetae]